MKTNKARTNTLKNHEGAPARFVNVEGQLKRSILSCMLWENEFYEDGQTIADRIGSLAAQCSKEFVVSLALQARSVFNLRHAPLLLLLDLIKRGGSGVANAIYATVQRPDEIAELAALYWKFNPDKDFSKQMKLGLGRAFGKFTEYQLAKWDSKDNAVRLRDVMFLCHPKPLNATGKFTRAQRKEGVSKKLNESETLYAKLAADNLDNPDTWESRMAGGEAKVSVFTDLLKRKKLGYMALLRNLRGMNEAGVDHDLIKEAILTGDHARVLPFRFIAAARHAPMFEPVLDTAMQNSLQEMPRLPGTTFVLLDVSQSMSHKLSAKSDLTRSEAAAALGILLVGICENVRVFIFGNTMREVPARKGMALADQVRWKQENTYLGQAVSELGLMPHDRLIVLTDEQSSDPVPNPKPGVKGYMINVASAKNGVGYRPWIHIDGMSEACVAFIQESEKFAD